MTQYYQPQKNTNIATHHRYLELKRPVVLPCQCYIDPHCIFFQPRLKRLRQLISTIFFFLWRPFQSLIQLPVFQLPLNLCLKLTYHTFKHIF